MNDESSFAGGVFRPEMTASQLAKSAEDDGQRVNVNDRQTMRSETSSSMGNDRPDGSPIWKLDALVT